MIALPTSSLELLGSHTSWNYQEISEPLSSCNLFLSRCFPPSCWLSPCKNNLCKINNVRAYKSLPLCVPFRDIPWHSQAFRDVQSFRIVWISHFCLLCCAWCHMLRRHLLRLPEDLEHTGHSDTKMRKGRKRGQWKEDRSWHTVVNGVRHTLRHLGTQRLWCVVSWQAD